MNALFGELGSVIVSIWVECIAAFVEKHVSGERGSAICLGTLIFKLLVSRSYLTSQDRKSDKVSLI